MSFGLSVGDFIAVGELTWTVYRACKGAPGEFHELSRELSNLHTILHELEDEAKTPTSLLNRRGGARKAELDGLVRDLSGVLMQIEDIVERYHSLGRDQKKTWDRVRFAQEDLTSLRSKLLVYTNGINVFMASLSAGSLARIEIILDELIQDIKTGRKEPTAISANDDTDEVAWTELERELIGDGITKQDVEKYKEDIREYLKKLVLENLVGIGSRSTDTLTENLDEMELLDGPSRQSSLDSIPVQSLTLASEDPTFVNGQIPTSTTPSIVPQPTQQRATTPQRDTHPISNHEADTPTEAYGSPLFNKNLLEKLKQYSKIDVSKSPEDEALAKNIKPVSFRGLVDVSATSTLPVTAIRAEIQRVLKEMSLKFGLSPDGSIVYRRMGLSDEFARIIIVKIPLFYLHGIQFKSSATNMACRMKKGSETTEAHILSRLQL